MSLFFTVQAETVSLKYLTSAQLNPIMFAFVLRMYERGTVHGKVGNIFNVFSFDNLKFYLVLFFFF